MHIEDRWEMHISLQLSLNSHPGMLCYFDSICELEVISKEKNKTTEKDDFAQIFLCFLKI